MFYVPKALHTRCTVQYWTKFCFVYKLHQIWSLVIVIVWRRTHIAQYQHQKAPHHAQIMKITKKSMSLRNIVLVCVFPLQSDRNNIFWFDRRMKSRNAETKRCKKCPIAYQNIGDNCECLVWANIMVFRVVKRVSLSLQAQWKMWKIRYANEALCVVTKTTRLQKKL